MRHSIILVRCPSCGCLSIDFVSLMMANARNSVGAGNAQQCSGCPRMLPLPDQFRGADGSLHVVSGRGAVEAFIVELISGLREMVDDNGRIQASQIDYSKLPPLLKTIYDLANKHRGTAFAITLMFALLEYALPFLENYQEYWQDSSLSRQGHTQALAEGDQQHRHAVELEKLKAKHANEIEKLRHDLAAERERQSAEIQNLTGEEEEVLDWLRSLPKFESPENDDSPTGALNAVKQFVSQFNELNRRLRRLEWIYKQHLLDSAGQAQASAIREAKPKSLDVKNHPSGLAEPGR